MLNQENPGFFLRSARTATAGFNGADAGHGTASNNEGVLVAGERLVDSVAVARP